MVAGDRRLYEIAESPLPGIGPGTHIIGRALDKMLEVPVDGRDTAERICRACERDLCRGETCPVDAAADRFEAAKEAAGS